MANCNRRPPKVNPAPDWLPIGPRAWIVLVAVIGLVLAMVLARTVTINGGIHITLR